MYLSPSLFLTYTFFGLWPHFNIYETFFKLIFIVDCGCTYVNVKIQVRLSFSTAKSTVNDPAFTRCGQNQIWDQF